MPRRSAVGGLGGAAARSPAVPRFLLLADAGAAPLFAAGSTAGVDAAAATLLNISISGREQLVSAPGLLDALTDAAHHAVASFASRPSGGCLGCGSSSTSSSPGAPRRRGAGRTRPPPARGSRHYPLVTASSLGSGDVYVQHGLLCFERRRRRPHPWLARTGSRRGRAAAALQ